MMFAVRRFAVLCFICGVLAGTTSLAAAAGILKHTAHLKFDTTSHRVDVQDEIEVPAGLTQLRLGSAFTLTEIQAAGQAPARVADVVSTVQDSSGSGWGVDLARLGLLSQGGKLRLSYHAVFHESVDDVVFSRENVGGEITATISDAGIYLSGAAEWLAGAVGTMATYDLALETPLGFETVTQGTRRRHEITLTGLQTRWVTSSPSDGINLIANRYFVHEEQVRDGLISMTFFLEDEARLRATYMERTHHYLAMYEEMIGPYPYAKFATVENWFPTGYGMPSYTLLGGQILRLPFIPYTSFGHEIAHNWWGNSVFVDTAEGNWCEGLTVYCADYHYKALESAAAAREYRRVILKDYAAYVQDPANDFPLSEFLSRHSGATRAVGYGKSMMVFHMIEQQIGHEAFLMGLRTVAKEHQYRAASWSDFIEAFAAAGELDLSVFQQQWLTRKGAPELALGEVDFQKHRVKIELQQTQPVYELWVPVVVTSAAGTETHRLHLVESSQSFTIKGESISQVAVDPDDHLFRRLAPQEIEPTITQVLAAVEPAFVTGADEPMMLASSEAFAAAFVEQDGVEIHTDGQLVPGGRTNIVINPDQEVFSQLAPAELQLVGSAIFLGGKRYKSREFDLVFAAADPQDASLTHLVVVCRSPSRLEGLARRIGHYGKYSWLMLPVGTGRPDRGNWTPGDSPLVRARSD